MAENNLLNVKVKNGTFYVSSKEDKGEGWEKNTFPNPQNKDETLTRYHRSLSIKGKVNMLKMEDDKYQGKVLSMIIGGEDESYSLKIPVMDKGGTVKTTNQYFNSLVGSLENVSKGDEVTMFVNNKNEDKNGRLYKNIVALDSDGKLIKSNFNFKDTPKWIKKEITDDFGEETVEWDASPTNKFYIDLFKKVLDNFGSESSTPQPKQESKPKAKPKVQEEDSELPF